MMIWNDDIWRRYNVIDKIDKCGWLTLLLFDHGLLVLELLSQLK